MRKPIAISLLLLLLAAAGCSNRAAELLDTARLEEKQFNPEHARQLYAEIVRDYPASNEAAAARERLAALSATP